MKKFIIRMVFNKAERDLISEAVLSHTDYPDDVAVEHVGEEWYETQQKMATTIYEMMS
jgi:hypothetical protein